MSEIEVNTLFLFSIQPAKLRGFTNDLVNREAEYVQISTGDVCGTLTND